MGLWSWLTGVNHEGDTANENPASSVGPTYNPGDPEGVAFEGDKVESRAVPSFHPSPWSGWPAEWSTPEWDFSSRYNALVDVAWNCLDKNASVLSSMPVYRTKDGRIIEPATWMANPDPMVYSSWHEFAKQLFWDFQLGETFVLSLSEFSDGYPMRFRVMPPWSIDVQMENGGRVYRIGSSTGPDVTDSILHIRYKSTSDGARGVGPLETAGGRMVTAGVLAKYVREFAETGGVPVRSLETDDHLEPEEAQDLQTQYMASRVQAASAPPVLDGGVKLVDHPSVSPKEAAMLEIAQFTEGRIANLLGVPPFLVGLPSGGDSMTYSNVSNLFDFHDRSYLRTAAAHVMGALSYWCLPRGQNAELNRDEYSRPSFNDRADAWKKLYETGAVTAADIRAAERLQGNEPTNAATALTGGEE